MQPDNKDCAHLDGATLVFDLDGTLVDTAPDLFGALHHALDGAALPKAPEDHIRPFISHGARRMIAESIVHAGETRSDAHIDDLLKNFLKHYAENVAVRSTPYPSLTDILTVSAQAGAKLAVCTNKRERLARLLLRELKLHDRFGAILGYDTLDVHKPDPRHLTETIACAGGDPDRAIMVGDSPTDVATAKAAGIPVIAVSFGYSEVHHSELGADIVIHHYSEFLEAARMLLQR
ncbi:MAG: HAD-IA family hydrolase [Hyphomicrobiaceae bacterium]|nr:HAD-IA family hydrolase [Hyphomicrobiaceae bacterium]